MGFLDSVKSHFKNNEEEEFERAFQEGAWPQGVELEPMTNTGSFLPATFEVDPLADASLPGNAQRLGSQLDDASDSWAADSVVRAAGTTPVYAQPQAPSPFAVIDASSKPIAPSLASSSATPLTSALAADLRQGASTGAQGASGTTVMAATPEPASQPASPASRPQQETSAPAHSPYATPAPFVSPVAPRPQQTGAQRPVSEAKADARPVDAARQAPLPWERESGVTPASVSAPMPVVRASRPEESDGGVQVFAREDGQRAARPAAAPQAQKPFAERLRERVAAANVSGQTDDTLGRSRAALQNDTAAPARGRRAAGADGDIDAELAERRRARRAAEDAREEHRRSAERSADAERSRAAQGEPPASGAGAAASAQVDAAAPRPVPVSAVVIRARSYDDVREVAQAVMAQHRPAVLVLKGSTGEVARRVLDFSFGLCCGTGATMRELGDRVYAVLPRNTDMTDDDLLHLRRQGLIRR